MARPINKLTDRKVASLKESGRHSDGGGLYLRITPQGARSWVFMVKVGKKRAEIGLGPLTAVPLSSARRVAEKMREAVALGADPRAVIAPAEVGATGSTCPEDAVPTFGAMADAILADILPGFKNPKHRQQWENTLKSYAAPLRDMRVDRITTDHVLGILRPIWRTKNETAKRLRGRIERILGAAKAAGHRPKDSQNPAAWDDHLEHFLTAKKRRDKGHHAAVPVEEASAVWAALATRRNSASVEALRITILSVCRTGETIGARRKEVDLESRIWTIPAERTKMERPHTVALSEHAVAIFARICEGRGPEDFLFPGAGKAGHLSNMAMLMLLQDDMGREETVHGFRSTFRDWAGDETGFHRDLCEVALAHAVGDETEQAYRRRTAIEKRRPLMNAWAEFLETGITPKWARPIEVVGNTASRTAPAQKVSPVRRRTEQAAEDLQTTLF
jgi:integrase